MNNESSIHREIEAHELTAINPAAYPPLELDIEEYRSDLAEFNLTPDQEAELLRTLWSIMRMFVEMGINADICGQLLDGFNDAASPDSPDDKILTSTATEAMRHDDGKEPSP